MPDDAVMPTNFFRGLTGNQMHGKCGGVDSRRDKCIQFDRLESNAKVPGGDWRSAYSTALEVI